MDARQQSLRRTLEMLPEAPNRDVIEDVTTSAGETLMTEQNSSNAHAEDRLQSTEDELVDCEAMLDFADDGDDLS